MIQGGYVSPSSAKTLTVSKKSNVLDKIPPRGPKGAAQNTNSTNINNNNNNSLTTIATSSIDVSIAIVSQKNLAYPFLSVAHHQVSSDASLLM